MRLDEDAATIDQLDAVGDGHVATVQRRAARDRGTECLLDNSDDRPIHR